MPTGVSTLFLCGDVMTGRGVDQILPHPGDSRLREPHVRDARTYVELAEVVNGPIRRGVDFAWPWGDALEVLDETAPDARVINLETAITRSDDFAAGKAVHYRMAPENLACLTVARPDVCCLANNHVLDFGHQGLRDTLHTLAKATVATVGAGRDAREAGRPVARKIDNRGRLIVYSCAMESSGVTQFWAATEVRPGVNLLDSSAVSAAHLADEVRTVKRAGDVVVVSIHWGSNWGYDVPAEHVEFAHQLIDGGVDVVHGHSSHHPRPIEIYHGKLILYGCGDFIDDYEGISGYEEFRDDLRLMYFVSIERDTGRLARLQMTTMQARQMRLHHATIEDSKWLVGLLKGISRGFGSDFGLALDGTIGLCV